MSAEVQARAAIVSMELVGGLAWVFGIMSWCVIRRLFDKVTKRVRDIARLRSASERIGLITAIAGLAVVPGLHVASGFPGWGDYPAQPWAIALGMVVYGGAIWLSWRSHKDLGRNWSITLEIRDRHRLVSTGVYGLIRHPMYLSFWLMALGQALLLANWAVGLAGCFGFGILFFLRVDREEQMMLETFGAEYRSYMARTNKIIPYIY